MCQLVVTVGDSSFHPAYVYETPPEGLLEQFKHGRPVIVNMIHLLYSPRLSLNTFPLTGEQGESLQDYFQQRIYLLLQ